VGRLSRIPAAVGTQGYPAGMVADFRARDPGRRIEALEGRADRADDYLHGVLSNEISALRGMTGVLELGIHSLRAEMRDLRAAEAGNAAALDALGKKLVAATRQPL
jgi:hypothetical protein